MGKEDYYSILLLIMLHILKQASEKGLQEFTQNKLVCHDLLKRPHKGHLQSGALRMVKKQNKHVLLYYYSFCID